MIVESLFNGMSCAYVALERAGIKVDKYYSSEIDIHANKVSEINFPDIIQLGDVTNWREWDNKEVDILLGGSPCQGFSMAGKKGGTRAIMNGKEVTISSLEEYDLAKKLKAEFLSQSHLFWEFVGRLRYLQSIGQAKYVLLENVKMSKQNNEMISKALGIEPILINSSLVSAQNRERLYWTNIPNVSIPEDKNIKLSDIIDFDKESCQVGLKAKDKYESETGKTNLCETLKKELGCNNYLKLDKKMKIKTNQNKSSCLTGGGNSGGNHSDMDILFLSPDKLRRYSVEECELLQTLPVGYTKGVSNSQAYKMLGNGWTVDVIAHILRGIKEVE